MNGTPRPPHKEVHGRREDKPSPYSVFVELPTNKDNSADDRSGESLRRSAGLVSDDASCFRLFMIACRTRAPRRLELGESKHTGAVAIYHVNTSTGNSEHSEGDSGQSCL
jgi:hypothetical protein